MSIIYLDEHKASKALVDFNMRRIWHEMEWRSPLKRLLHYRKFKAERDEIDVARAYIHRIRVSE